MTEQEATAFVERLIRIWSPLEVRTRSGYKRVQWHIQKGRLNFTAPVTACVIFEIFPLLDTSFLMLFRREGQTITGRLSCVLSTGQFGNDVFDTSQQKELFVEFAAEWVPFFRRCCWLSGAPIEASAHEKAEWMQGFSREELETWNLKM